MRALPLLLLLSIACESGDRLPPSNGNTGSIDTLEETGVEDTAAPVDTADTDTEADDPTSLILGVEALQNEKISTLFTMDWEARAAVRAMARMELPSGKVLETPWSDVLAESGTVELRGMPPFVDVEVRLVVQTDEGEQATSRLQLLRTGGPPSSMPVFTATAGDSAGPLVHGWLLSTVISDKASSGHDPSLFIVDEAGQMVWWWELEQGGDDTAVALSRDGEWVIFISNGELHRVRFDGSEEQVLVDMDSTHGGGVHHHFLELEDGTIAFLSIDVLEAAGGGFYQVHTLRELTPTGEIRRVWSLADDLDVLIPYHGEPKPGDPNPLILGNVNHITYDAVRDQYIVGLQSEGIVFAVRRSSGDLVWYVRPQVQDEGLSFSGGDPWTATHGTELTPDGFLAFVNSTVADECARVVAARLDQDLETLTQTWSYSGSSCHTAPVMGDVHQIADDTVMVTWATSAQLEQVGFDGKSRGLLTASFGQGFGYGGFYTDLYGEE